VLVQRCPQIHARQVDARVRDDVELPRNLAVQGLVPFEALNFPLGAVFVDTADLGDHVPEPATNENLL
jgi:hypothetical protein